MAPILFYMNKICSSIPPFCFSSLFSQFFCFHQGMAIESEILDGFLYSRCLNDSMDLPDMIGSFASSGNASLVAKNGTKKSFDYYG